MRIQQTKELAIPHFCRFHSVHELDLAFSRSSIDLIFFKKLCAICRILWYRCIIRSELIGFVHWHIHRSILCTKWTSSTQDYGCNALYQLRFGSIFISIFILLFFFSSPPSSSSDTPLVSTTTDVHHSSHNLGMVHFITTHICSGVCDCELRRPLGTSQWWYYPFFPLSFFALYLTLFKFSMPSWLWCHPNALHLHSIFCECPDEFELALWYWTAVSSVVIIFHRSICGYPTNLNPPHPVTIKPYCVWYRTSTTVS